MKRTEQINVKITPETKKALQELAKKKDWTVAHTANRLLEESLGLIPKLEDTDDGAD